MTYTQGPWRVESGEIVGAEGQRVGGAARDEMRVSPTERDQNVRLMASAPELLENCKKLLLWINTIGVMYGDEKLIDAMPNDYGRRLAVEAIHKAKGRKA